MRTRVKYVPKMFKAEWRGRESEDVHPPVESETPGAATEPEEPA